MDENTLEDSLKKMILDRYGTLQNFSDIIGLPCSTVKGILTRGVMNANVNNVIKMANELGIDVDGLAQNVISDKQLRRTTLSPAETRLYKYWTLMSDDGRKVLEDMSKRTAALYPREKETDHPVEDDATKDVNVEPALPSRTRRSRGGGVSGGGTKK